MKSESADIKEYRLVPGYDEDGKETGYYTREPDGVSGMTVSALAEFCGVTQEAVTRLLNRVRDSDPITNDLPESLKPFAGKEWRLITNDLEGRLIIPDEVCSTVTEYYAFDARQYEGKQIAISNYRIAARAGLRVFIWSKTGYVPEFLRKELKAHTTTYIERLENIRDHVVPDELWTTFREGAEVLLLVEKEMKVPVDQMDLCDGSIGSHWSKYREGKGWAIQSGSYIHVFRDQRRERECRAYDLSELSQFRKWLREKYVPYHLPEYLAHKYGKLAVREIYEDMDAASDRVEQVTDMKRVTAKQQRLYEEFQVARKRLMGGEFRPLPSADDEDL